MKTQRALVALLVAAVLSTSACSSKSTSSGGGGSDVKTDKGVTKSAITLGALADLSGPFQQLGKGTIEGHKLWAKEVNAGGGICKRDIKIEVRDHGYKADAGVVAFQELEPNVAGFIQILGSPVNAALDQSLVDTKTTAVALSWSSFILKNPFVVIPGTTYDIEMINGLSYLRDQKKIADGDTIGYIYLEGEYGENGLLGATYFAKKHNITLKKVKVLGTDTDLRNVVTGLKGAGVKAIGLTSTPAQAASVATVSEQLGLNVPLIGNNPTFAPAILTKDTAKALSNLYVTASSVPFSSDVPKAMEVAGLYEASGTKDAPNAGVPYGYAIGRIWQQILEKACDNGDLTRDGIQKALRESSKVSTDNLVANLDLSKVGTPATREVYIAQPDVDSKGGLKQLAPLFVSDDAKSYVAPHQK